MGERKIMSLTNNTKIVHCTRVDTQSASLIHFGVGVGKTKEITEKIN